MKIQDEKGNILILILVILVLMTSISIYFTQTVKFNKKSMLYEAYKLKSDMGTNHGLTLMLKELTSYYKNKQELVSGMEVGFTNVVYIPDEPNKELQINYEYNTVQNEQTVDYKLEQRTKISKTNYRFYDMIPSVSEQFQVAKDDSNNDLYISDGINKVFSGQIAVTGVSNSTVSTSTFFIVAYDEINKNLNIYSMDALQDANKTITLNKTVSVLDLYKTKNGESSTKDIITLDNQIKAQAIYNPSDNTTKIYIAVSNNNEGKIDVFKSDANNAFNMSYVGTADIVCSKFDFSGAYFYDGIDDKEELFVVTEQGTSIKLLALYPDTGTIFNQKGNTLSLLYEPANIAVSAIWDSAISTSPDVYMCLVEDNKQNVNMYTFRTETDTDFTYKINGKMDQSTCGNMNTVPFYADQIKVITLYNTVLGVKTYLIAGNEKDSEIFSYYKYIDTGGISWDKQEIDHGVDEGVGRVSGCAVSHYTRGANAFKLLAITPTPVLKHVTIVNKELEPNILVSTFINVTRELAKSNMQPKILIEYTEQEMNEARKIEKVSVLEYNIN